MEKKRLNMGCGFYPKNGYVNLDWNKTEGIDVVHDLNKFPYPFKDNTFDEIYASHIIEHLNDSLVVMKEIHRITKNNGIVIIKVPHFSIYNALTELSHKHCFSYQSFDAYTRWDKSLFNYGNIKFKMLEKRINFSRGSKLRFLNVIFNPLINKILLRGFNLYERFFCYILPSEELIFVMQVVK